MHILLFTPYFNQPRGNSTTARRIIHHFNKQNIHTSVFSYMENDNWIGSQAGIFHILHATHFLEWAKDNNFVINRPYVVTMGGTDINIELQGSMDNDMFSFLNDASFITVFNEELKEKVEHLFAGWADKTIVIPQGIWVPWNITPESKEMKPAFLLPSGLRPVKDVLHALPALDELTLQYPDMSFTILGPNLDDNVFKEVQEMTYARPWMRYDVVPYESMKDKYKQAQIVINTSLSEGQSAAIMEAMAIGLPVIARKIPGNQQLITHGETGWLYKSMDEFKEAVHSIVEDLSLREKVILQAKEWINQNFSPKEEASEYIKLYSQLL